MTINLSSRDVLIEDREDLTGYLGGVALATQLLREHVMVEKSSLEEMQPIIFTKGPLNTIFPAVTKTCSMFKSPLTEELGESYGGLRTALAMGMAGLDGIVIFGKAKEPVYIHIDGEKAEMKDAKPLWYQNTDETTRLLHEQVGRPGLRSILAIGEGGINQVRFANVTVDTYRHFGRLGLGCLMGSKNLKAIVIEGEKSQPVEDPKSYRSLYREVYKKVTKTDVMEKYHGLGTSINISLLNDLGGLPINNFQKTSDVGAKAISGESFAQHRLIKKIACSGCPIGCIHIALHRKNFGEPYEYEMATVSYDHELIYSLGSMIGIWSMDGILELIETVELAGLDAITTGVLLSWITEAFDKEIISTEETIVRPKFGDVEGYKKIIHHLVKRSNDFYEEASTGTYRVSRRYGGQDFAMVLGKNEVAGYHTGYGNIIGQAVGARHSHLDNAGYAIDQENQKYNQEEMVQKLMEEEINRNFLNSLVICLFARKVYDDKTVVKALNSIGYDFDEKKLKDLGLKTFLEKIRLKKEMGFHYKKTSFPKRFFETSCCNTVIKKEEAEAILNLYSEEVEKLLSHT